jgi:autophagy-related protein 13
MLSRSPPKAVGMGRTTSAGGEPIVADLFILPTRVPSMGAPTTGTTALIPPPRPSFAFPSANPSTTSVAAAQPIPASGLAVHRLHRESLNSSSSSSISTRDRDNPNAYPYPANPSNPSNPNLFSAGATGTTTAAAGASVGGTSSLSSSPIPGALPIRRPHLNPVHPFKSNTISSGSGSSPSLSIRQGVSGHAPFVAGGGSPSPGVGGILPHNLHSRQASASSARVPPSPVHVASFTPSSLGDRDRRPGTSGSGSRASLDKDRERRGSSSGVAMGGERERETETERTTHEGMSVPMAMPPRKRYSSSFGHRYVSSVGSATGGGVVGAGSGAGSASASGSGLSAGSGGKVIGEGGSPGSGNGSGVGVGVGPVGTGGGARKEVRFDPFFFELVFFQCSFALYTSVYAFISVPTHLSILYISVYPSSDIFSLFCAQGITSLLGLGATTDDDDISIFVQHIDERKPLSSHDKERERDRDVLAMRAAAASGQGHDREPPAAATSSSSSKGKQRAGAATAGQEEHEHEDEEDNGQLQFGLGLGHARYTTSSPPPPMSALVPGSNVTSTASSTSNEVDDEEAAAAAAALLSTSPTRGPMLTNRDEVDERLKRMNENFLNSLEGIGGSRSRGRGRETRKGSVAATTTGMRGGKEKETERADDSSHSNLKEPSESAASSSSAASNNKDNNNNNNPPTSRFSQRTLDVGFPSTSSSSSSRGGAGAGGGGAADVYPSYPYNNNNNTPSLGLGLGRGRHTPPGSSAMLGNSDGISMASQGSEEVIGRMELYEERRRSGYHGA